MADFTKTFFDADDETSQAVLDELLSFSSSKGAAPKKPAAAAAAAPAADPVAVQPMASASGPPAKPPGKPAPPTSLAPKAATRQESTSPPPSGAKPPVSNDVLKAQRELEAIMDAALVGLEDPDSRGRSQSVVDADDEEFFRVSGGAAVEYTSPVASTVIGGDAQEDAAVDFEEQANPSVHPGAFGFDLWAPIEEPTSMSEEDGGESETTDLANELAQRDSRIAVLEAQLAVARQNQAAAEGGGGSVASLRQEVTALRAILASANDRTKELETEMASVRQTDGDWQGRLSEAESEILRLRQALAEAARDKDELESMLAAATADRAALEEQLEAAQSVGQQERDAGASMALQRRLAELRTTTQTQEQKLKKYRRMLMQADTEHKAFDRFTDAVLDRSKIFARRLAVMYGKSKDSIALCKQLYLKLDYDALKDRLPNILGTLELKGKAWSERCIIMKDNFWFAFKSKSGVPAMIGRLDLATVEVCVGDPKLENAFRMRSEDAKETIWRAKNRKDMDQWIGCIAKGTAFLSMETFKKPPRTPLFAEGEGGMSTLAEDPAASSRRLSVAVGAPVLMSTSGSVRVAKPYSLVDDKDDGSSKRIAAM